MGPLDREPAHRHDTGEADHQAGGLAWARKLARGDGSDERGDYRYSPVDHPCEGRVDPLLRDGKEQERDRHPEHTHDRDGSPVRPLDRSPGSLDPHDRGEAEQQAKQGDQGGPEVVKTDLDEDE
jgi:hypothetical protein